jgi:hypothetical protein
VADRLRPDVLGDDLDPHLYLIVGARSRVSSVIEPSIS